MRTGICDNLAGVYEIVSINTFGSSIKSQVLSGCGSCPCTFGGHMLRLMISQSGLHSNDCRVAGVGRTNPRRALTSGALLLLTSLFLLSSFGWAQEVTGSIVGTVLDPNGAAVSGATITARDLDRGTVLTTSTNDEGAFNISGVPVGRYEVQATAKGFQGAVNRNLTITLNQTTRSEEN